MKYSHEQKLVISSLLLILSWISILVTLIILAKDYFPDVMVSLFGSWILCLFIPGFWEWYMKNLDKVLNWIYKKLP